MTRDRCDEPHKYPVAGGECAVWLCGGEANAFNPIGHWLCMGYC